MIITWTGYRLSNKGKKVTLTGIRVTNECNNKLTQENRTYSWSSYSDDREWEYDFDVSGKGVYLYLRNYLKTKDCTKDAKTWHDALSALIGVSMKSPSKLYLARIDGEDTAFIDWYNPY